MFLKNGFKDITASVNRGTGTGLKRGDVLLNEAHHVAMYCGSGKEVEASLSRGEYPGSLVCKIELYHFGMIWVIFVSHTLVTIKKFVMKKAHKAHKIKRSF